MEFTGEIKNLTRDWKTDQLQITFSVNEQSVLQEIDGLKDCKLSIKAGKYRKKRSLDANAYAWILMTKIANHPQVKSSKDEIYEEMLQKYGYLYKDDEGYIVITIKSDIDISKVQGHWKSYRNNGKFTSYLMIKGSSEYDTVEMAHFIDMLVSEAKELGIETLPPDEIERMKEMWGVNIG